MEESWDDGVLTLASLSGMLNCTLPWGCGSVEREQGM